MQPRVRSHCVALLNCRMHQCWFAWPGFVWCFDGVLLLLCRSHLHPRARQPDQTDRPNGAAEPGRRIRPNARGRRGAPVIEQQQEPLPDQTERVPHITTTMKRATSSGAPLKSAIYRASTKLNPSITKATYEGLQPVRAGFASASWDDW